MRPNTIRRSICMSVLSLLLALVAFTFLNSAELAPTASAKRVSQEQRNGATYVLTVFCSREYHPGLTVIQP